ncbi:MAG TPA: UDP-N-acetylmuramyl-tripeptide synthetase [Lacipirellulaceae bacterium]|nr:UDP-N-acetylmuramyl-tripeptide synthetase [Lacipirellulaceae bacterium]
MSAPLATVGIPLRQLLAAELRGDCPSDLRVTSCTCEWQQVRPGDVYIAITGDEDDGHDFATEAVNRGAVAVIAERILPIFNVPVCIVDDSRTAYGRLCQALVGNPASQMKVIGVTGSKGKTTVARLLSAVLREAGNTVGTLDSFGYWDGVEDRAPSNASLTPPALARLLAEMSAVGATHAVVEISSQDLACRTFAGVTLDAVCITNVGRQHLDVHGSVENYRNAKRRVFEHLNESGVAILNADDPVSIGFLDELTGPVLTFGMNGASEISAQPVEQYINEQTFLLNAGDDSVGVRTEIVGDHHIYNCLAAATTALTYGVELTKIARGLESVDRLPGRMERVMGGQPFAVLVDSADSPDALRSCLRAARKAVTGRLICVFGASNDSDNSELPAIGRVLGAMTDLTAVTKGHSGEHGSHRSCLEIRSGFAELNKVQVILDRQEAIQWALKEAQNGDVVVIAGMGAEPHTPLGSEGALANDSEIVRESLRRIPAATALRLAA